MKKPLMDRPLRAAIYARYSSNEQRPESIEDQVAQCQRYCDGRGWTVVAIYSDAARTGSTDKRPGFQNLTAGLQAREFDVVVVEAQDRLSRRLSDAARFYDHLTFVGGTLHTCDRGEVTPLMLGILGAMSQSFLADLRHKTNRGLEGKIKKGLSAGGLSYGYDLDKAEEGARKINEEQAKIVRMIFKLYADGASPRSIAAQLNRERIPGPGGRPWGDTTIRGQVDRGTGILNNSTYIGKLEWNRCSYICDPRTGNRVARPNPREQWFTAEVPDLRIVDDELWEKVKSRQAEVRTEMARDESGQALNRAHRGKYILSGLIFCCECGKPFALRDSKNYVYSTNRSGGACGNRQRAPRKDLEEVVAEALRHQFVSATRVEEIYNQIREISESSSAGEKTECERLKARAKQTAAQIDRIVIAIADGADSRALAAKLKTLESEAEGLAEKIAELEASTEELPPLDLPLVAALLNDTVNRLEEAFNDPESHLFYELHALVRKLVDQIVVPSSPKNLPNPSYQMHGLMVGLLEAAGLLSEPAKGERPPVGWADGLGLSVVAGTRNHLKLLLTTEA